MNFGYSEKISPDSAAVGNDPSTAPVNSTNQQSELPVGLKGVNNNQGVNYKRWSKLKYSGYVRSYNQFRHSPKGIDMVLLQNKI